MKKISSMFSIRSYIQGYQLNGVYKDGEKPEFDNKIGASIMFKLPHGPGALARSLKVVRKCLYYIL